MLMGSHLFNTFVFIDDTVTASGKPEYEWLENIRLHAKDLDDFLGRLAAHGGRLSISKFQLVKRFIIFCGFLVGSGRCFPSEDTLKKLDNVKEKARIDMTHKEWLSIEGLINFSSRFIPGYSKTRAKAVEIRKIYTDQVESISSDGTNNQKEKALQTTKEACQKQLTEIVESWVECIKSNTLTCPKPGSKLGLATDASGVAISYVLFELETRRIIEFGGRKLPEASQRYDILEKEAAAVAEACTMTRQFTYMAESTNIHIDNKNLLANIRNVKAPLNERLLK